MKNDQYGRSVSKTSDGNLDTYTVTGLDGVAFTVQKETGTPENSVYDTINAMAPENQESISIDE